MSLQIELLENSFDLIAPQGDLLMDTFYSKLFEVAPSVQPLFASVDLKKQKGMLLSALVLVRKSLRDLPSIVPALQAMGARHVKYGTEDAHYAVVGQVLLASMAAIAGDAWKAEYTNAWADAYNVVASTMIAGAAEARAAAAPATHA
ncbi:hypothetical protein SAMD00019534_093990 [Acytostelium subglobosum LB1]|uniref:hypothetical protein n=1 Tax=Acytostelium subglobosum LB1 TaxID=1410327 RepID=UPI0006451D51|nr:hypothetical protein SAMD00019534_093990 [Acytostelium subglobosum LB1]GAM26224.1 hypothetical protein SAMD00019534_093990 [Acytostelium subglobosum LB1]|eukprot:XP_012750778.1 hypothetical protein SAMD00019534_093990 [Acytostelium subglobosum LB1]